MSVSLRTSAPSPQTPSPFPHPALRATFSRAEKEGANA